MNKYLTHCLDFLFPPRDTALLVRTLTAENLLEHYREQYRDTITYLLPYTAPSVQAAITEQKFYTNHIARTLLAAVLQQWYDRQSTARPLYFVPMPLSATRQRQRGYNQIETVLRATLPAEQILLAVERTRDTAPQTSLERTARADNVANAFEGRPAKQAGLPTNAHFVLVDDVLTTGATMNAARAALAPHLLSTQKLTCLALAH
ncbi:ComF family protein [Candidatus Kaiserbacteria bacterium]|nr:ComF family protein [Candidatus Kaiserbacteria bacterium]